MEAQCGDYRLATERDMLVAFIRAYDKSRSVEALNAMTMDELKAVYAHIAKTRRTRRK